MNDVIGNNGVRVSVIGVLAILALFLFVETINVVQNFGRPSTPPTNVITVQGEGKAAAVPDVARITFGVQESAKSVADAQQQATKRGNDAIAAMKDLGIKDTDVRTISYDVSPQYSSTACPPGTFCPNTSNVITGYQVMEMVEVTVHDTSKAGDVLQKLGSLGVQNISGPNFTLDNPDSVKAQARAEAIQKARAQAQTLAKQLDVRLGQVVSFSENNQPYPMYGVGGGISAKAADVAPSIPTGQNEYTEDVSITYEIR